MRFSLVALAGAVGLAQATVPSDLSSGFEKSQVSLEVSFSQDVSSSSQDGQSYSQAQAMYQPNFALSDSSAADAQLSFVIIAVDTTESDKRFLHYVHHDYKKTDVKNILASESAADLGWWAPGYLGESGKGRSYSYLLYKQPENFKIANLPKLGEQVQVADFVSGCGLQKAIAGISITVDIVQVNNDYTSYQGKYNKYGGYDSYWNYMPQYNQYNLGYNQNGQYGNQYQQGYNQYQYQGYNQGYYSTSSQAYSQYQTYQQNTYSTYEQNTYNTYQQNTYESYQQSSYNAYQPYTSASYAAPAYETGAPPPPPPPAAYSQGGSPPPYPTTPAAAAAASSTPGSGVAFATGSSPAAAATSPSASLLVGAGVSTRDGAWVAIVAGAGVAGLALVI